MGEHTFAPGDLVFQKGDPSPLAYSIESGEVELLDVRDGNSVRIALLGPGSILGEMGLVEERPRSVTARALGEVRVTTITREEFLDRILNRPQETLRYLHALFERLRTMNNRVLKVDGEAQPKASLRFEVVLFPLTTEAAAAVPGDGLCIANSPFRVGRAPGLEENRVDSNDLVLADTQPYNVSRNHFSIEILPEGVFVHDRGSFLGTLVDGKAMGGRHHMVTMPLPEGEHELIAGLKKSPFRFRLTVKSTG